MSCGLMLGGGLLRNGRVVWDGVEWGLYRLGGIEIRCRLGRS